MSSLSPSLSPSHSPSPSQRAGFDIQRLYEYKGSQSAPTSLVSFHVPANTSNLTSVIARMQSELPQAQNIKDAGNRKAVMIALGQCV